MIHLKTNEEIQIMAEGGRRLMKVVDELIPWIEEGMSTNHIDEKAGKLFEKYEVEASFKKVKGYKWNTCLPVNAQVVHTPPTKRTLKKGDVLTVDIGAYYQGYHTDYATTIVIGGTTTPKIAQFLDVGKKTLDLAIAQAKADVYLGVISKTVENEIYGNNYFILKDLTGHGVGKELHEDPYVFNYLERPIEKTYKIKPGLVIAVEVIYSFGSEEIAHDSDSDWSISTADGSISACFEKTIAITNKDTYILT